jgi:hypothetical protein|tara:strand:+ start:200 stop:463 length:264 start_codon:yes stop_codon:yes gene_type:complete
MAFNAANLTRMAGASGVALWHYTSADAIATVNTAGYFNGASGMLNIRDVIIVVDSNTPTTNLANVLSNASGVVDISNGTAIIETDAD